MSVPGGGGGRAFLSRYIDENILTPLISRLQVITDDERFRGSAGDSALLEDLDGIRGMMTDLLAFFGKMGESERFLVHHFDPIEELVDGVLESIAAGDGDAAALQPKLAGVRAQIGVITEVIAGSYKIRSESWSSSSSKGSAAAATEGMIRGAVHDDDVGGGEKMVHLRRAVQGMDVRLRHCLLCLAAFPEGAVVNKRLLIHWWIGEGLVASADEGAARFRQLVDMRFLCAVTRPHCDAAHACTVHPWIRSMLVDVARSSVFLEVDHLDGAGGSSSSKHDFTRTRRACLRAGDAPPGSRFQFHPEVSTIYNVGQNYVKLSSAWFSGKAQLGTIQLGQWRAPDPREQIADPKKSHVELIAGEHLNDIGACKNLRYLSLRGISRIKAIPAAIGKLGELLVLDLRACHNLQVLTKEVTKLHKLQYLDVSECYLLVEMPEGLGKMSQLHVLKGFVLASSSRKNSCHLNELANLRHLHKLSINVDKKLKRAGARLRTLVKLTSLRSLKITWGMMASQEGRGRSDAANVQFALPSNLSKLDLCCFPSKEFADMISADGDGLDVSNKLTKLYVTGGMLRSLGSRGLHKGECKVQVLRVRYLKHLQCDWEVLHQLYKELEVVEAQHCPGLAHWPLSERRFWMKSDEITGGT